MQTTTTAESELLTLAEAARLLGVSRGTLYNWRQLDYGPPALRTKPIVYARAVVLDWKARRHCSECGRARAPQGRPHIGGHRAR